MKQEYAQHWNDFRHALKQRNRLLKSRQDPKLLDYWDDYLLRPSLELERMRNAQCAELQQVLQDEFADLLQDIPIAMTYRRGWAQDVDLELALQRHRDRDKASGFTGVGVHRDDYSFSSDGHRSADVLSRGQCKRVCLALLLASLKLVGRQTGKSIVLLVDDLHSELDEQARERAYRLFAELDLQLFVSNIDGLPTADLPAKEFKVFHVEHGTIKPRIFS